MMGQPSRALSFFLLLTLLFLYLANQADAAEKTGGNGKGKDKDLAQNGHHVKSDQQRNLKLNHPEGKLEKSKKNNNVIGKPMSKPVKLQQSGKPVKNGKRLKNTSHGESNKRGKAVAGHRKANVAHKKIATHDDDDKDGKGGLVTKVLCWISNLIYNALRIRFFGQMCEKGKNNGTTIKTTRPSASVSTTSLPSTPGPGSTSKQPDAASSTTSQIQTSLTSTSNIPSSASTTAGSQGTVSSPSPTTAQPATTPSTSTPTLTKPSTDTSLTTPSTGTPLTTPSATDGSTSASVTTSPSTTSIATSTATTANPYCAIQSCASSGNISAHTLCQLSYDSIGAACNQFNATLAAFDPAPAVSTFNIARVTAANGFYQNTSSNMRALYWDAELAQIAQTWAQQCSDQKDTCRDVNRFEVGQITYVLSSNTRRTSSVGPPDWMAFIQQGLFPSFNGLTLSDIASFPSGLSTILNSVAQAIWAETYLVGCGVSVYTSTNASDTEPYKTLFVCNFGPTGNIVGQPIFLFGPKGSNCTAQNGTNSDGLCVTPH